MDQTPSNLFLIGMPGSGKSSVGKALAQRLGFRFIDSDEVIVERTGVSIATIFEVEGEAGFRQREERVIAELIEQPQIVLATGGGAILSAATRERLRTHGHVLYLRATLNDLIKRTRNDRNRPLLAGADLAGKLASLLHAREALYEQTAHLAIDSTAKNAGRTADRILALLGTNPK